MNAVTDLRLDALEHAVNGNGRPGLKTEVAVLKKDVAELSDIKARLSRVERSIWIAVGAIGGLQLLLKLTH